MVNETDLFVSRFLAGAATAEDIDDCVAAWHESDSDVSLAVWLGMTEEQYRVWVEHPDQLGSVLRRARRSSGPAAVEAV